MSYFYHLYSRKLGVQPHFGDWVVKKNSILKTKNSDLNKAEKLKYLEKIRFRGTNKITTLGKNTDLYERQNSDKPKNWKKIFIREKIIVDINEPKN